MHFKNALEMDVKNMGPKMVTDQNYIFKFIFKIYFLSAYLRGYQTNNRSKHRLVLNTKIFFVRSLLVRKNTNR